MKIHQRPFMVLNETYSECFKYFGEASCCFAIDPKITFTIMEKKLLFACYIVSKYSN